MHYSQLLEELKDNADESYKAFHRRMLKNDKINVLGVRVPLLRKIGRAHV